MACTMALSLVDDPDYAGRAGIEQLDQLQQALQQALIQQNWLEVQRLDKICAAVVNKVVAARHEVTDDLVTALSQLKDVYRHLINGCQAKVASMAV
jgi:HPt (histidine-containing phosphotransfer) domain-containing protein